VFALPTTAMTTATTTRAKRLTRTRVWTRPSVPPALPGHGNSAEALPERFLPVLLGVASDSYADGYPWQAQPIEFGY